MPERRDERREIRILCRINVIFRINSQNFYGTCNNLGLHGMFIGFDGEVAIGDTVEISFMVSDTGSSLVEAWGKVIWVNCGPGRSAELQEGFGIEFTELTTESRALIVNFIEQCSR